MGRSLTLSVLTFAASVSARGIYFYNGCPFTIWPAIYTDPGSQSSATSTIPTGWQADAFSRKTITVPENWKGQIWARRNCDFTSSSTASQCLNGGCSGGLLCNSTGTPPVTVAEFTLQGDGNKDYYDISLVGGFNLPMRIDNSIGGSCGAASCIVDVLSNCPEQLKGPFNPSGQALGCKSACVANLDGTPSDSANCCTGSHNTPATCSPSNVAYYSYFKSKCPNTYAYPFDESSGTALWTCDSSLKTDYFVTFCPY